MYIQLLDALIPLSDADAFEMYDDAQARVEQCLDHPKNRGFTGFQKMAKMRGGQQASMLSLHLMT